MQLLSINNFAYNVLRILIKVYKYKFLIRILELAFFCLFADLLKI
jgi:hypothetical protein